MLELALWLKKNGFRADQVQAFLPSPMATATAMYHSGKNPLKKIIALERGGRRSEGKQVRRLHKAFLRYHDPENWPVLREALKRMGRADLIGNGKQHLIPAYQPVGARAAPRWHGRFAPSTRGCRNPAPARRRRPQKAARTCSRHGAFLRAGERNCLLACPACD